jgi:hypothetical protein
MVYANGLEQIFPEHDHEVAGPISTASDLEKRTRLRKAQAHDLWSMTIWIIETVSP